MLHNTSPTAGTSQNDALTNLDLALQCDSYAASHPGYAAYAYGWRRARPTDLSVLACFAALEIR